MIKARWLKLLAAAAVAPVTLGACSGDAPEPGGKAPVAASASAVAEQEPVVAGNVSITVTPATGAKGVPVSAEVGVSVTNGTLKSVALRDGKGTALAGELRPDGSSWVPAKPLKPRQKYEATVTAADAAGRESTATTAFTTMGEAGQRTGTGLYLFDDRTYGVAMPVVAEFSPGIKKKDRAAVQKRMLVKTEPPQPGTWSWTASGTQAYYRAPQFWQSGTKLSVRLAVGGLPTGKGLHGDQDRSATATIGRDLRMVVDNKTKKMTVTQDGKAIRTIPVSLGKKSTPSSSGVMVIMEKKESTVFDTTDTDGADGYVTDIDYAQRITWSGNYVHSAPWSVGAQGSRNVSHGCVNVSPSNARWLFGKTLIGDPITVRGTGHKLAYGDGWTPWDVSWSEFAKGSALPVPAGLG